MLNYTRKCINTISFVITFIICIFLFIMLDICLYRLQENTSNQNIYINNTVKESKCLLKKNLNDKVINIEDTFIELMQIADIYDENTKIEEIEQTKDINSNKENEKDLTNIDRNNKWRIKIPKINLDAPIKSGTSQTILAQAVGHFDESAKWTGNVALAGHNRGYNCNFFQNIKKLKEGDEIIYCTEKGERKYKVTINKIIKQTDWSYIKNTNDNRITLITCVENMYEYRRCIQAVEII